MLNCKMKSAAESRASERLTILFDNLLINFKAMLLDFDLKIPLTCHMNYVDIITGNLSMAWSKQDAKN